MSPQRNVLQAAFVFVLPASGLTHFFPINAPCR
uniref:Uncharacterized protein n=1 Tax=Arundo donax TaxID=35708 RepID=A0A0A9B614_ARUDO